MSTTADRTAGLHRYMTPVLAGTVVAVYALILTGATASLVEAGGACSSWPVCEGVDPLASTTVLVAMVHRAVTLLVGLVVIGLGVVVWAADVPRGVRWPVTIAAALFPVQVAMGAVTAVSGGSDALGLAHLSLAMAIFAAVLVGLMRWLEWETRAVEPRYDATAARPEAPSVEAGSPGVIRSYLELTKPRLMWLLCAVALAGIGLAVATTAAAISAETVAGTLLGGVLAIGASGTFNHVLERDVDRRMARTADRPVATHAVPTRRALTFGALLAAASLGVFLWLVNPLSAALGVAAIAFYSIVYTVVLKPNTTQNIVLGGAVGAFPALIGWAAVTGSIGLPALVLGAIIFLWTPAHFYNLALAYRRDYARGGFPMLPVVRGARTTHRHIVGYLGATLMAVAVLGAVSTLGWLYVGTAVAFAAVFLYTVVDLYRHRTHTAAMRAFAASNAFLGALMLVIVVETLVL